MLTKLCHTSALTQGQALGFAVANGSVIVVRQDKHVFAYHNLCPHLRIPLEWQPQDFICPATDLLRCATHGALFVVETGECVSGPCVGQFLQAIRIVIDEHGDLLLDLPTP